MPSLLKKILRRRSRSSAGNNQDRNTNSKNNGTRRQKDSLIKRRLDEEEDDTMNIPAPVSMIEMDRSALVSPLKSPKMNRNSSMPSLATTINDSTSALSTNQSSWNSGNSSSSSSSDDADTEEDTLTSSSSLFKGMTIPPRPSNSRWSEADFQTIIRVWHCSQLEINQLRELEASLGDLDHWINDPAHVVRYLKGPQGHKPAEQLFRKMVQWRIDNNVDTILEDYTPPGILMDYCPSAILHGLDKDGDPIYLERAGVTDAAGLLKRYGHDALIKHVIWLRELVDRGIWKQEHEERMGRPIAEITIVYDLAGLNSRHLKAGVLPFFVAMIKVTQDYYTSPVKCMCIIRAPSIFRYVWPIVKHIFPPSAHEKMTFSGPHNHEEALSQFMDLSVLPPVISAQHGRGYCAEGMPERLEGGIPPTEEYDTSHVFVKPIIATKTKTTSTASLDSPTFTLATEITTSSPMSVSTSRLASGSFQFNDVAIDPLAEEGAVID